MPAWLLPILINFVIKFGVPQLLLWLKKRFGFELSPKVVQVLEDYAEEHANNQYLLQKKVTKQLAACDGVGCAPSVKKV